MFYSYNTQNRKWESRSIIYYALAEEKSDTYALFSVLSGVVATQEARLDHEPVARRSTHSLHRIHGFTYTRWYLDS